jgi:SAM-dependent methyltransferase
MVSSSGASEPTSAPPYTILAAGYDFVMSHVDYRFWAEYIYTILERHHPDAHMVVELGCGTGSLAIALQPLGGFRYLATDLSEAMLEVARQKAHETNTEVRFDRADFTEFNVDTPVDVLLLLYDGLNYLLDDDRIRGLMKSAFAALARGGVFIVDQSTPSNSINNEPFFEHSDSVDIFSYVRRSFYDSESRLHRTTLEISVDGQDFREEHIQRAYESGEIEALATEAGLKIEAAYDGFSTESATADSERVHWVFRRPRHDDV